MDDTFWKEFRQLRRELMVMVMEHKCCVTDLYMEAKLSPSGNVIGGKITIAFDPQQFDETKNQLIERFTHMYAVFGKSNQRDLTIYIAKQEIAIEFIAQKTSLDSQRIVKDPTGKFIVGTNVSFLGIGP